MCSPCNLLSPIRPWRDFRLPRPFFCAGGENLVDANRKPVVLSLPNKLVYSPHAYGPGDGSEAHHMPYFDARDFPRNMGAIWQRHFGHLLSTGATVIVGEWGGFFRDKDRQWQETFARYLKDNKLSSFYWCLNPNSEDSTSCTDHLLLAQTVRASPPTHRSRLMARLSFWQREVY